MNLLFMFEIEVARPYSWWVAERMKWRLICQAQTVTINGRAWIWAADETYDEKNHEGNVPPYRRHGSYGGRGEAVGAWCNRRCGLATVITALRTAHLALVALPNVYTTKDTILPRTQSHL